MELTSRDAQEIQKLKRFADSPDELEKDHHDCELCKERRQHLFHMSTGHLMAYVAVLAIPSGAALFYISLCMGTDMPPGVVALVFAAEIVATLLVMPKMELQARRETHTRVRARRSEGVQISNALLGAINGMNVSATAQIKFMEIALEGFQQLAMNRQYELRERSENLDARSDLLSAISHARELAAGLAAYREESELFMKGTLEQARGLELQANAAAGSTDELMAKCVAIYRPFRTWHEALMNACKDDDLNARIKDALGSDFDYVNTLKTLEQFLGQLPHIPASDD